MQYYFAQATDEQGITGNVATTMGLVEFAATLDNSQSGYSESGTGWTQASGSGDYLDTSRHHAAASGQDIANWQFSNLPSGEYNIYGTWSAASGQATNAPFTVYDGSSLAGTQRVDEQTAPTGVTADGQNWQLLGTYYIGSGQMTVQLSDDANGTVVADAIRIVDPPATLYWDPDGNAANNNIETGDGLGGSGTWNGTSACWYNPSTGTDVVWNNNNGDTAVSRARQERSRPRYIPISSLDRSSLRVPATRFRTATGISNWPAAALASRLTMVLMPRSAE